MEKLEHFLHNPLFEFNRGRKQRRRPETFAPCIGTMPSLRAWQENGSLVLRRIVLTLVTLHAQEDLRGLMKIVLNILIHNDSRQCTRELANVMNCDHSTIVRHLHSMDKVKNQWVVICASLLARHRLLVNNIDHSYPVSLLVTRNGVSMLASGKVRNG